MKYSIIMPTLNHIRYTVEAVESVFKHTEDFELIVVDGGSTDGTRPWLRGYAEQQPSLVPIYTATKPGFPTQVNAGLKTAKGDFLVILNNDTVVTPQWADLLREAIIEGAEKAAVARVGLAGPLSKSVAGRQAYVQADYTPETLDSFAVAHAKDNRGQVFLTGFLSGFCMMISRNCFEDVGLFDVEFNPGGFGDNAYMLRAEEKGWRGVIVPSVFIHHYGSITLKDEQFTHMQGGLHNREKFYRTFADHAPKKLVAAFRVRNCADTLTPALDRAAEFAEEIVVLCDRCTDRTPQVADEHPAVMAVADKQGEFNEMQDRADLLSLAKKRDPHWIIVLDHDELPEKKFDDAYAQRLMHPANPHVKCYGFRWYTFWDSIQNYRTDGIFGNIHGFRMFKNEPMQILASSDPLGFHMGSIPQFAPENFRWTNIRIQHFGYVIEEERKRKHAFYTQTDQVKNPMGIGADNYDHLIAGEVTLKRWEDHNTLAFVIVVEDQYHPLAEHLDTISYVADQIIVVQTVPDPRIRDLAQTYGAEVYDYKFQKDYSKLRQFAKSKARTDWIFTCDPDEAVDPAMVEELPRLIDVEADGYLITITNFRPGENPTSLDAIRLFRHEAAFRYQGVVHENFDAAIEKHHLTILPCPYGLQHFGWLRDPESYKKKMDMYKALNRKQLRRHPDDKMAMFNMALHEMEEGHFLKARNLLVRAAGLDPVYFPPRVQLTVLHLEQAQQFMREAIAILPDNHRLRPEMTAALQHITQALV